MKSVKQLSVIDVHTDGSPVRVVIGGVGPVPGATIAQKRDFLRSNRDDLRTLLMYEPRGHAGMSGSIVMDPCDSRADIGIVFIEVSGWLPMCGHGTIGTVTALIESGILASTEPVTNLVVEVPAGLVRVHAEVSQGSVTSVTIANVASYLAFPDVELDVPGWGQLTLDVAYGGNFYPMVDAGDLGITLVPAQVDRILSATRAIRSSLAEVLDPVHPESPWIRGIEHVMLVEPVTGRPKTGRNTVLYGENGIARDPCGTGTCARMAQLFARGQLALGESFIHQGLIGTAYRGRLESTTRVGEFDAVLPTVTGSAYITGTANYLLDPADPFPRGFGVGYGSELV